MNVLSLFDGMSCGQLALQRLGITDYIYRASEIDQYAMKVTQANFPDTIPVGDVEDIDLSALPKIDLLLGGSPCQGFSFAGKQLAFDDPRSKLFFTYAWILKELREVNPEITFLMENVRMRKEYLDVISEYLGVEPMQINSALVSAQNRVRFYWSNIGGITQPEDRGILLKDVVHSDAVESTVCHTPSLLHSEKAVTYMNRKVKGGRSHWDFKHHSDTKNPKSATVVANFFKGVPYNVLKDGGMIRKFSPEECEVLQTVPQKYTDHVSNTQRYKMIGNGWTVDVIAHILSFMEAKEG
jgi:site-specific DNA-cytosine methylase